MNAYLKSHISIVAVAVTAICIFALVGCGVTITAERVPTTNLEQMLSKPGIYYALPKTEISLAIPVTLEITKPGAFGHDFEECLKVCAEKPPT